MKKSVLSPLMAVAWNILMVFVVYTLARVEYLFVNWEFFAQSAHEGRIFGLLCAGPVFDTPGIFYTNAIYVLLMLLPLHLKERPAYYRFCKWVFIVINAAALIVNFADSVYFSYTMRRTSWSIFSEFGNETNFGKIVLVELGRHWYLVVVAALIIWGMWKLYVTPAMVMSRQPKVRYYVLTTLSLVAAGVTVASGIRGGLLNHWYNYLLAFPLAYAAWRLYKAQPASTTRRIGGALCALGAVALLATAPIGGWRHRDIRPIAISNANAYTQYPVETALVLNTPFTMIRSIGNVPFADPGYFADKQELDKIYSPVHLPSDSVAENRRNVVVLIVESLGREYIGALNKEILGEEYKGYTPFVDSLVSVSAHWRHTYNNGQKSIDGMPSVLAGIPMFVRPFIVTPQAVNTIHGLPALLGEKGYDTAFFHGARTGSMGFDGFARSVGFNSYYGREDFERDSRFGGAKEFDGYWAIWDEPFLQYYAHKMTEMKEPFMTAVFTASNHHPFHVPERYAGKLPEGTMPIHKTAAYTDLALRRFFETACKQPWYENTIFVITDDHTNMREHDEYMSGIGVFYGPILIFDPKGEIAPGEREGIAQQTDIMPTLLGATGYDHPYVAFGCDLLNTPPDQTWAVNYVGNLYQYVKGEFVLQFDGSKTVGFYAIDDHLMQHNLVGTRHEQQQMERELKAIIQSYMDRMLSNKLTY